MNDDFLTSEQTENYGRYVAEPNEEHLARLSPLIHGHINMLGH
ncbi:transposase [Rahnella sp. AA]|nr:transposase [Rahnella sp. AA]